MSLLNAILIGLATGLVFGFALEKSRVFEPGAIVGQMQLRSFLMLKIFLAAVITGLLVLAVLHGAFNVKLSHNRHWLTEYGTEWRNRIQIGEVPQIFTELSGSWNTVGGPVFHSESTALANPFERHQ